MTTLTIAWSKAVNWPNAVQTVLAYYQARPDLKYGPAQENKSVPFLNMLCELKCASRTHLRHALDLETDDAVMTILSNLTMALQKGPVLAPEEGGWYVTIDDPFAYVVAPGFAMAWIASKGEA